MKIFIKLDSNFYTFEENHWCYKNMIEIEWSLPFMPTEDDHFDAESIIDEDMPEFDNGFLSWTVDFIAWKRIKKADCIAPVLWLKGE